MTKDVVLVPTYWRPGYLRQSLERLFSCDGIESKEVWVCQDRRATDTWKFREQIWATNELIKEYKDRVRYIDRAPHSYSGASFNIVDSYKKAYGHGSEHVYMVQEDILVSKDFFTWHEMVQSSVDCFCSTAWRPDRYSLIAPSDDPGFFTTHKAYSGVGVCWKRDSMREISALAYSNIRIHGEQDMQIRNLIDRNNYTVAGAYKARAFHIGVIGNQRLCQTGADCDIPD